MTGKNDWMDPTEDADLEIKHLVENTALFPLERISTAMNRYGFPRA